MIKPTRDRTSCFTAAASASDSVASLTAKGLTEKSRAADDGRAVTLRLGISSRALANRISKATGFAADAAGQLPTATQNDLFAALLALIGKLQKTDYFSQIRACVIFEPGNRGDAAVHHCRLVNASLRAGGLRPDCPEHAQADPAAVHTYWRTLEWVQSTP